MMPLIEQDPARRVLPRSRRVDHHQSMIGDHDVGLAARPFGPLDEASAIVRTAGIDAFAPAVGQRSRPRPTEQARQPAGQVPADHVAVLAISRPAPDQLRQDRGPAAERALQRVLEVEQAKVVLTTFPDHDPLRALLGVCEQLRTLAVELPLQCLGKGRHPHRSARLLRPQRRGREVSERLADPRARLGEQHVRRALRGFRSEHLRDRFGHCLLPLARLDPPGQLVEPGPRIGRIDQHRPRRRPLGRFLP